MDLDGDGRVTLEEVQKVLSQSIAPSELKDLQRMLSEVDVNKDGSLDYEEYLKCMWDEGEDAAKLAAQRHKPPAQPTAAQATAATAAPNPAATAATATTAATAATPAAAAGSVAASSPAPAAAATTTASPAKR